MSKTTVTFLALLCCAATLGAAWLLRPPPPAKIPPPPKERAPTIVEVYRDCIEEAETGPGAERCRKILDHDLETRRQKLDHALRKLPEKRADRAQRAKDFRTLVKQCMGYQARQMRTDADNTCYRTAQLITKEY